ncbi:SPFH domain-containing protein [Actinokineospora enzanensis]|uniref:SPFH domain-containing protein n=1 Tax=Actinokineospora enzanensis TaxID=155975 RepID=UPI000381B16A|nr:SPFH domain-containing protein [Actinokineospora enzanensis]
MSDGGVILLVVFIALLVVAVMVFVRGLVNVPLHRSAIVTRRFGRIGSGPVAVGSAVRVIDSGRLTWVPWWFYDVVVVENIVIPPDCVGVVHARLGRPLTMNQSIARPVRCAGFRDVVAFQRGGGQQGPQAEVLPAGTYALHPELFSVRVVPRVVVPARSIGLVKANVGTIMPPGRTLADHVECDHFQNAVAFLVGGGQQGIQQAVLPGGSSYAINPMMFEVYTVDTVPENLDLRPDDLRLESVDGEDVGVVIVTESRARDEAWTDTSADLAPVVPGHDHFQLPWMFLANGGRVGPQTETLPGGATYAINPLFARVVHIPTRELILSWQVKDGAADRYDSALRPIEFKIEGVPIRVELTQTLAIPARTAPLLVKRFGEDADEDGDTGHRKAAAVKRLVERVLGPVVHGYFTQLSVKRTVEQFIEGLDSVQTRLTDQVTRALDEQGVVARLTTISSFTFQSEEIDQQFRKVVAARQRRRELTEQLASQDVINQIERRKLEIVTEGIEAEERAFIKLFGRDHRADERKAAIMVKAPVPQVIVSGADSSSVAPLLLPQLIRDHRTPPPRQGGWTIDIPTEPERIERGHPEVIPDADPDG